MISKWDSKIILYHLDVTQMAIMTAIRWCYHMLFPPSSFLLDSRNDEKNIIFFCSVVNHHKWQEQQQQQPNQESDWVNSHSVFCHQPLTKCQMPFAFNSFWWCCCCAVSVAFFVGVCVLLCFFCCCGCQFSCDLLWTNPLANLIESYALSLSLSRYDAVWFDICFALTTNVCNLISHSRHPYRSIYVLFFYSLWVFFVSLHR